MRRILVLVLVVGSVVLPAIPAQAAIHYYFKMRPQGGTTLIETDCPAKGKLTVTRGGIKQSITVPNKRTFTTSTLNRVARARGTVVANCTPPSKGHTRLEILPFTGVTTSRQLVAGLALLGVGTVLLLFGFSPSSKRPRRRRRPVKVYAQ